MVTLFLQIRREEQELRFRSNYFFFLIKILVCQIKRTSIHVKTHQIAFNANAPDEMHRQFQAFEGKSASPSYPSLHIGLLALMPTFRSMAENQV